MEALHIAELTIDPDKYLVFRGVRFVALTRMEFGILYLLVSNNGRVLSREEIIHFLRGDEARSDLWTVDVHVCNIRKKLSELGGPDIISVLKGVGYRMSQKWIEPT